MSSETGKTGPIDEDVRLSEATVMASFFAVSIWNCIQTFIFIFATFKRYSGLYFWSMTVANAAIPIRQIFALIRFYGLAPSLVMTPFVSIGFWAMVTGQSMVLYSRLCLVVSEPVKLRCVLGMITFTFFFVEVPVSALLIASNVPGREYLAMAFTVLENCQTGLISAQEALISGLYLHEAKRAFKPMQVIKEEQVRKTMRSLVWLFVLTVMLDLSLMGLAYSGRWFATMTSYKGVVYSVKLQIEGIVLNNLTKLVRRRSCNCASTVAENYMSNAMNIPGMWLREPGPTLDQGATRKNSAQGRLSGGYLGQKRPMAMTPANPERYNTELRRIFGTDQNP